MEQNTQETALLVMDIQGGTMAMLPETQALINNLNKVIVHAREKKMPVIYVIVGFRPGMPEVSMSNKSFGASKKQMSSINMEDFMKIVPELAPQDGDITIVKRRRSAFTGSDLAVVLSAFGIRHMVLTGVATSGVVLSTLLEASDKDYQLTVIADCCADRDNEVHHVLTTKVFPKQADVYTTEEWCSL